MSVTPNAGESAATHEIEALTEEAQIRHRAIGIAFYACMTVVTVQLGVTAAEILWGGSQGGTIPAQISLKAPCRTGAGQPGSSPNRLGIAITLRSKTHPYRRVNGGSGHHTLVRLPGLS